MRNLPPLNHLRSFEAAARLLSFTLAAVELNLTQAAVSGHVRALEHFIGGPLFNRHPRSLSLTSLGRAYVPGIQQALVQVDQATSSILRQHRRDRVVVSCPVSLIDCWLAGALGDFASLYPDVSISVHGRIWADELPEIADIIITNVHEDSIGKNTINLWQEDLVPVCAPGFRVEGKKLSSPQQLLKAGLIHNLGRADFWAETMAHFGVPGQRLPDAYQANTFEASLALAASGTGVAIVPERIAAPWLESGRLDAPLGTAGRSPWACTISDESLLNSESAKRLHQFLITSAADAST